MSPEEEIQQNYRCVIDDLKEQIECMKKSGRRRREEVKRLKKTLNGNAITMRMDADGNLWWI